MLSLIKMGHSRIAFLSVLLWLSSALAAEIPQAIPQSEEMRSTGFELVQEYIDARLYTYQGQIDYLVSNEEFYELKTAEAFCASDFELATPEEILLIGASKAPIFDEFLKESITFEFPESSGWWGWLNPELEEGDVFLIERAEDVKVDVVEIEEINNFLTMLYSEKHGLPAICVRHHLN